MRYSLSKNTSMVRVHLSGSGIESFNLVEPCVLAWFSAPFNTKVCIGGAYEETIPKAVLLSYRRCVGFNASTKTVYLTSESYQNDRALAEMGLRFDSMTQLDAYVHSKNIDVLGDYEARIY